MAAMLTRKLRLCHVTGTEARACASSSAPASSTSSASRPAAAEARARMDVDFKSGEAEIAFNPDYVLGVQDCEEGLVRLTFNERSSPASSRSPRATSTSLMPITIEG